MIRYITGLFGLVFLYFFSPISTLYTGSLFVVYEMLFNKSRRKYIISAAYMFVAGILPLLAWKIIYVTTLSEAYFTGFPHNQTLFSLLLACFAWLFIPFMLLLIRFMPVITSKKTQGQRFLPIFLATALTAFVAGGLYYTIDVRITMMLAMSHEISKENWTEALRISRNYPTNNRLISYYTNIALYNTGQMLDNFFDYRQTGPNALFLDWRREYFTAMSGSEVFFQMGFNNEANRWALEALIASNSGKNPFLLKRLVQTAIINEEYAVATKYLHFLKPTLFHRKWAKEHLSLIEEIEQIDNIAWVSDKRSQWVTNDFLSGRVAPANLPLFFKENPKNKMAFEYLMMYYLLTKNLNDFINNIYLAANFDYTSMPKIFEEAVLVYLNMMDADLETYLTYPVKKETYQRFNDYFQIFSKYRQEPHLQKSFLYDNFGNTYWYYFHFYTLSTRQNE